MRGARVFLVRLVLAAGVGATGAFAGQTIEITSYGEMGPVIFDHGRHAEDVRCEECHHPERSRGGHRCGACHRGSSAESRVTLEDAAHKPGVGKCWACHLGPKARKKLECEGCHRS